MAFDPHTYHYDYYPVYRKINFEIQKVNERDINQHKLKSKSLADLHTAFGLLNEMDRSVKKTTQLTNKTFLANEIAHAKLMKLKQKRMYEDVDKQKHFIRYKNDWIFREDVGLEPHYAGSYLPPINLQPPILYNTIVEPNCSHSCLDRFCNDCYLERKAFEHKEEYNQLSYVSLKGKVTTQSRIIKQQSQHDLLPDDIPLAIELDRDDIDLEPLIHHEYSNENQSSKQYQNSLPKLKRSVRQPSIIRENPYPTTLRRASSRQFIQEQQRLQNQIELQKYNRSRSFFEIKEHFLYERPSGQQTTASSVSNRLSLRVDFSEFQVSSLKRLNELYKRMSKPLELDQSENVVNYNWIVDGILKNSTPYETHRDQHANTTSNRGRKKLIDKQWSSMKIKRGRKSFASLAAERKQSYQSSSNLRREQFRKQNEDQDFYSQCLTSMDKQKCTVIKIPRTTQKNMNSCAQLSANYQHDSTSPDIVDNQAQDLSTNFLHHQQKVQSSDSLQYHHYENEDKSLSQTNNNPYSNNNEYLIPLRNYHEYSYENISQKQVGNGIERMLYDFDHLTNTIQPFITDHIQQHSNGIEQIQHNNESENYYDQQSPITGAINNFIYGCQDPQNEYQFEQTQNIYQDQLHKISNRQHAFDNSSINQNQIMTEDQQMGQVVYSSQITNQFIQQSFEQSHVQSPPSKQKHHIN
ncbi:UNKNOWN [Stylonychia lemnae]|uniref:Uncharacterized protein n=1 Tax=Stylonychia lemnae TaxID=5949 RepID=A0A078A2V3_STYLE|nr:UNKNOWN [Stylonychia lemnae]|eukprot:CDW76162.1 UNKNOWN [Stylonychia lemnae]